MTHVTTSIFWGLYKNTVIKSVALVTKKVMVYFRFFFIKWTSLFTALNPSLCIQKQIFYYKVTFILVFKVIVSKLRVLGQKKTRGGWGLSLFMVKTDRQTNRNYFFIPWERNGFQYAGKVKVCNESIVFPLLSYTSYYPGDSRSALSKIFKNKSEF